MNIGKAIYYYRVRDKRDLNATTLSRLIGLGKERITGMERKSTEFTVLTLMKVCKELNIKLSDLILKAEQYE